MGDNIAPADRAAKIVLMLRGENTSALAHSQIQEVAAEIRAAVEESLNDDPVWRKMRQQAKAEAYEDAAKIVEAFQPLRGLRPDIEKHDEAVREMLASNIRARAADHKNCVKLNFIGKLDPLPFQWDDDAEIK